MLLCMNSDIPDDSQSASTSTTLPSSSVPRYYSQLKKAAKERQIPEIREDDIEESFIRGTVSLNPHYVHAFDMCFRGR